MKRRQRGTANKRVLFSLFLLGPFLFPVGAHAEIDEASIVVNETRTPIGDEFYRLFSQYWESIPKPVEINVVIQEEFTAQVGSIVKVYSNDTLIYMSNRLTLTEVENEVKTSLGYALSYMMYKKEILDP